MPLESVKASLPKHSLGGKPSRKGLEGVFVEDADAVATALVRCYDAGILECAYVLHRGGQKPLYHTTPERHAQYVEHRISIPILNYMAKYRD